MKNKPYVLTLKGILMNLQYPRVLAIINVTPDSFACHCTSVTEAAVLQSASLALQQGADILDIGGCSTRPGADPVSESEEWERVSLALRAIRSAYPDVPVSLDTFRAGIAQRAIDDFQVDIINDISDLQDDKMLDVLVRTHAAYILVYNHAEPGTLTESEYMSRVVDNLARQLDRLHHAGVSDVVVDPGFGFNKTMEQNYCLLRRLADLQVLDAPVLAGLSRKSMLYKYLNISPSDAVNATTAAHMVALMNGADMLRVHDVKEAVETIKIWGILSN